MLILKPANMNDNIITKLGYSIEKSISGYYRLVKNNEVVYGDTPPAMTLTIMTPPYLSLKATLMSMRKHTNIRDTMSWKMRNFTTSEKRASTSQS